MFAITEASAADAPVATKIKSIGKYTAPNSDDDGKPRGISGMACLGQPADASRECLVINDEERFGEVATLTKEGLAAGGKEKSIEFVVKGESGDGVLGKAVDPKCKDEDGNIEKGKFNELDGEGIAIADGTVYVASSHSCSGGGKYKPSSYLLVRFKPNSATSFKGEKPVTVERSWRLADVLRNNDIQKVKDAYGKKKEDGTNIEGIAVIDRRLYAGMRTPIEPNKAFIVSALVDGLFASGKEALVGGEIKSITLDLGANAGIRDLAALPKSGALLILSGPAHDEAGVPYKLWVLEKPEQGAVPKPLVTVATATIGGDGKPGKAETVTVLEETPDALKVLVMYDNINEGEPTLYDIRIGK